MAENLLFNHLINGEIDSCNTYIEEALNGGGHLVTFLSEMLYTAASIKRIKNEDFHPIIVMNCIKNIIGDNRQSPSKILLSYCIEICKDREIIDYNKQVNDQSSTEISSSSVFVGALEDAIQSADWEAVHEIMPKIYFVSDRSRSIVDTIADLGFQDIEENGLMIFHLLRAFNFKQKKSHVWTYASCLISKLKGRQLPKPSPKGKLKPDDILESITSYRDISTIVNFAAMSRVWEGEYVRLRSYKREISSWLDESFSSNIMSNHISKPSGNPLKNNFVDIAEKIISKNSSKNIISRDITTLDALRYLKNKVGFNAFNFQVSHLLKK